MRTTRFTMRVLAGTTLVAGLFAGRADAQVKAEDVLARRPAQTSVAVTNPTGAELAGLKAEQVTWPKQGNNPAPTGVVVKDAAGRLVRQFIDTTGRNSPNIYSYYLNGVESYREVDGNGNGKPDQYRWLGPNGGKWGIDVNEDGKVDTWLVISAEELSQELFESIQTRDARRLEALLPSDQDLQSLGLPPAEAAKIRQRTAGAVKRMQDSAEALKLNEKSKWVHLELGLPHVTPGDAFGGREDLVKQRTATVLFDRGDGKTADVFQTGELVLIGRAWKLIDGPAPGAAGPADADPTGPAPVPIDPKVLADIQALNAITPPTDPAPAAMIKYHHDRAAILTKIVEKLQGADQEPWLRQLIDAYGGAADAGDERGKERLKAWAAQIEKLAPTGSVAAYSAFRIAAAEHAAQMAQPGINAAALAKVNESFREQLEKIAQKYPNSEEAPEALNRVAMIWESSNNGDAQARATYEKLARDYASHPFGIKAQGAIRRLTSEGQPAAITGATLDGKQFSINQLTGKAVVVFYWASWMNQADAELKQLAEIAKTYGPKGLEVVTINLDDEPGRAVAALNAAQMPGHHLYAPGGLDKSPLAAAYGIQMVPHVLLVGKDNKVTSKNAQTGPAFKDEIEKLLK